MSEKVFTGPLGGSYVFAINKRTGKSYKRYRKCTTQRSVKKRRRLTLQEEQDRLVLSRPFIPVKIYNPPEIWSIKQAPKPLTLWDRLKAVFSFE